MSKQSLLLVDGDTRSLRVLEVSLRKAGFSVTPAVSVGDALDKLEINAPDLIICETKFSTELDGFELRRRLRATPDWADIPFIFLTAETAIENKIKGLELGVDDYLTKPIYIKEIVTRINILLQKRQRQFLDLKKDGTRFAGRVADMPVVDVIQTIEVSRKSGVIQFTGGPNRQAAIYFRDGKVIDAEAGTLQGEDAVYRLLTWNEGEFEVEFRTVRRRESISSSSQGLLMEGMRRLDEWSRLLEQLPPLAHRFEIDAGELAQRLGEIPDDNNRILRLFDGKRTLLEVIDASDFGDLECLQAISRLYFEGLLTDLDPGVRSKRDTGKPMPLTLVEGGPSSPIEEVVSGPIDVAGLAARAREDDARTQDSTAADGGAQVGATAAPQVEPRMRRPSAPPQVESRARRPSAPQAESLLRRPSAQEIEERDVVEEEEIRGPLSGGYRPSSLRLIDEAVAAAQAIEPSLFEPEELAAAGLAPQPSSAAEPADRRAASAGAESAESPRDRQAGTESAEPPGESQAASAAAEADRPLARIKVAARSSDPRIENARDLIEKSPAMIEPSVPPSTNGQTRRKPPTKPPPIPVRAQLSQREIAAAPLLDAEPDTSGEHAVPSEQELAAADAQAAPVEVEAHEDSSGVPRAIAADEPSPPPDDTPPDRAPRRFAATVRRDESQGMRMIGSHGRDRAEASGELSPSPAKPTPPDTEEPQRELVTILPRRITREIAIQSPEGEPKVQTSLGAEADAAPATKVETGKPAVEPPPRPAARRISVEGGVVRQAGPGRGAKALIGLAAVLAGIAVYSYCREPAPATQQAASHDDAATVALTPEQDAATYQGFGTDAGAAAPADAAVRRPDARVRPDARPARPRADAAVMATLPRDAAVAVAPAVDAFDKNKEARSLYNRGHEALEDGDPQAALELLDHSLELRRTARTLLERARALQRMNRIDDAVAAIDDAIGINSKYAPAYEQKGMTLWSARRYQEARPALEKYLELEPDGRKAELIRGMLDEPR